jgi:uncharacterized membrane protein YfcA
MTPDLPVVDLRWVLATASVLAGGFMKGVSGMGLPAVATPVLAVLFDLPAAIAMTMPAATLSNVAILHAYRDQWREARRLTPILLPAVVGVVIGTRILVGVDPALLRGLLGALVLAFVTVSAFQRIPRWSDAVTRRLSPLVGIAAGTLQGAAGQSGPVVGMFLFQLALPRPAFLFVINAFFLVVDFTQTVSLASHGFYTPARSLQALVVGCLSIPMLLLALRHQHRISERLFRRAVLAVLALTGLTLVVRTITGA